MHGLLLPVLLVIISYLYLVMPLPFGQAVGLSANLLLFNRESMVLLFFSDLFKFRTEVETSLLTVLATPLLATTIRRTTVFQGPEPLFSTEVRHTGLQLQSSHHLWISSVIQ
jgi:hypothetical protein